MWRILRKVQGVTIAFHHVVRRRDDNRVVAQFPDTAEGRIAAEQDARQRNKDPNASMPPYYEDHVVEGEYFYDKHGRRHQHRHKERA